MIETCLKHACNPTTCPKMSAGPYVIYQWLDKSDKKYQEPKPVPAKEYMILLMDWIKKQIDDETIFPSDVSKYF